MKKINRGIIQSVCYLLLFILWTAAVLFVDVQQIGPQGSSVGLAGINEWFHSFTGVHMELYVVTDWLSLIPIGFIIGFAILGAIQWIRRKRFLLVDRSILVLGGFYIAVLIAFFLFEIAVVNYRPVLIDGVLEASYPSSTTMLIMCMMPTSIMQIEGRMKNGVFKRLVMIVMSLFSAFMVVGRAASGVHWFTDIVGGLLFSGFVVHFYCAFNKMK